MTWLFVVLWLASGLIARIWHHYWGINYFSPSLSEQEIFSFGYYWAFNIFVLAGAIYLIAFFVFAVVVHLIEKVSLRGNKK